MSPAAHDLHSDMSPAATRPVIPDHLRERQSKASDPGSSIWVSANAGSGKTHVLTQRVVRLLLNGVPPAKILCLTFTKAAAAQMATRVFDRLSEWTVLSDDKLRAAILDTGAPSSATANLDLARRLFTRTVETPGGLKIQTIHAFCERLLHLFPFEANVPARFEVADDLRAGEMLALAKRSAIEAAQRSTGPLGAALVLVADLAGAFGIDRLIGEAMKARVSVQAGGADLQATLRARLGGNERFSSVEAVQRAILQDGISPNRWPTIAASLESGSANDRGQAKRLRQAAAQAAEGLALAQAVVAYLSVFFGTDGRPRNRLITKGAENACPSLKAELEAEQARLATLLDDLKIAEAVERSTALVLLVDETVKRYEQAKIVHGVLDFDDLIERTLALLRRSDSGWVLHKLDAGIDHVLVDEAQDTSDAQWKILEHLTDDFAAGAGARSQERSVFVVGDDKQSIFSFQGAAPLMFDKMRSAFERRFRSAAKPFERVVLKTSFRSVPGILAAVDTVFEKASHQDGLVQIPDIWPRHESIKSRLPGLVEIWPRVKADSQPDPDDWSIPIDVPSERDPANVVADRVAKKIAMLLATGSGEYVHEGAQKRPVRAGDILILVRTRSAFFEAVIRALKRYGVPVAGADRLDVANHIAVMDLVAAGRAALLPADDLSLACVLKSPLFGFDDDDLIALAPHRTGPLFSTLAASDNPLYRTAHETIQCWGERAAAATPFAFYVELLGRDGGRRLMEQRLGPEAHDAMDELLRLALIHEQLGAPSLGTFLAEVEALETSVKRDMEGPGDNVRVMTVHAAKGLEAKIVFLPDTCGVPALSFDPVVFDLNKETGLPPVLVWSPRKGDDSNAIADVRAAERRAVMREYRRLFYVALTRAEERLYIAGFYHAREPAGDCWSAMVRDAFDDQAVEQVPAFWSELETVSRIATTGDGTDLRPSTTPPEQRQFGLGPDWLFKPVVAQPTRSTLRPSHAARPGVDDVRLGPAKRRESLVYGSAVHELLQHLPGRPASDREEAGRVFLRAREKTYPPSIHDDALAEALAVIALPALKPLFAPGARAEVAATGRIATPAGSFRDVDGKVDRLVVTADAVIVADFKTGQPTSEVSGPYLDQVALYRRVLMPLWPDRPLHALLVWTRGPTVIALDPISLDAAADAVLALP